MIWLRRWSRCLLNQLHRDNRSMNRRWFHLTLLLVWVLLGAGLRFANLTSKPLWTDEFATIVFSLGHSFLTIPLDRPLSITELLQPLHVTGRTSVQAVVHHLLQESNHPPLYFILTHWWLQLVSPSEGSVSVWAVRSLAAFFGVITIPATFGLTWLALRSQLTAHLAALVMAVSPFAVYLAQEARHYTLPLLWIAASLACLLVAVRKIERGTVLPLWVCLSWVGVNGLGIATHYFFVFSLIAEAVVLCALGIRNRWLDSLKGKNLLFAQGWRMGGVVLGTIASGLVWLPLVQHVQESELTRWIYRGDRSGLGFLQPLAQTLGGWITMLYLFPIQAPERGVAIASIVILLLATGWTVPKLYQGLAAQYFLAYLPLKLVQNCRTALNPEKQIQAPSHLPQCELTDQRLAVWLLGGFMLAAIALLLGITYLQGMDLTSAFRYNFIYFPAVVVVLGASLAGQWLWRPHGQRTVILIVFLSFLGSLTVVTNLAYQKTHRPDLVVKAMQTRTHYPALIAIAHRTHGQTGRMMGLAWEWQRHVAFTPAPEPQFLLAHQGDDPRSPVVALRRSLSSLPRPLDLWLVNFQDVPSIPLNALLKRHRCQKARDRQSVDGYQFKLYRCGEP